MKAKDDLITRKDMEIATKKAQLEVIHKLIIRPYRASKFPKSALGHALHSLSDWYSIIQVVCCCFGNRSVPVLIQ